MFPTVGTLSHHTSCESQSPPKQNSQTIKNVWSNINQCNFLFSHYFFLTYISKMVVSLIFPRSCKMLPVYFTIHPQKNPFPCCLGNLWMRRHYDPYLLCKTERDLCSTSPLQLLTSSNQEPRAPSACLCDVSRPLNMSGGFIQYKLLWKTLILADFSCCFIKAET